MSYQPGAGYPDLLTIRSWVGVPATVIDDAQLNKVAGAEQLFQQSFIAWPAGEDLPDDGYQAFLRLVARHLAAKGIPLGMLGADAEYGPTALSRFDAEIERLHGPLRKVVLG